MRRRVLPALLALTALLMMAGVSPAAADPIRGRLLLVLDSSGSMAEPAGDGRTKIQNARAALNTVVSSLDPQAEVGMRVYGARVFNRSQKGACTDSQLVVPVGRGNSAKLTAAIKKYEPYGETPIAYALAQAGKDVGTSGQRSILLVSDGEDTCNIDPCPVAAQLAAQGINVRIDVIGLGVAGKARDQLKCVADKGRGTYADAKDLDELTKQLTTAKDRALRPFEVTGTPVKGTADEADAPEIKAGRWTDKVPAKGDTTHYWITRSIPGSAIWVGATSQLKLAGSRANTAGLELALTTPDGSRCGEADATVFSGLSETQSVASALLTSRRQRANESCSTANELILTVTQTGHAKADSAGRPLQLDVSEEQPVTNLDELPEAADDRPIWKEMSLGRPAKIAGGTGFESAPLLDPEKTYRFDVKHGEVQVFAADVDWGQQLQVQGKVDKVPGARSGSVIKLDILGPYGGQASTSFGRGMPASSTASVSRYQSTKLAASTPEIRYNNVQLYKGPAVSRAGRFLIMVSFPKQENVKQPTVPVTLRAAVLGTAGAGAPTYGTLDEVPDQTSATARTTESAPTESTSTTPSTNPAEEGQPTGGSGDAADGPDSATPWPLVGGLVGGAVILGTVGVVALRRLRG